MGRTILRTVILVAGVSCLTVATGCQEPLFAPAAPRSPYERFMVLRGQYRQPQRQNAYGGDEPSLRDRLKPLDQP